MKFAKRTVSVLLAVLMLVSILPLSVSAASLKITTQPKTSYTAYGSTAKATVKATGDGLKYTWYVKNAGASKYTKSSVTKSTYTAKMTDSIKGRSVYCVVKDKKGKTVKSSTAILRMKATITTEPKTTYAKQGATAKLTVKAKGDGLKYAWYIKNAGKTKYTKSSVTKSTYSTTMSDKVHGRYVYCIVTDKYGKTDKSKTVVLRQQATIVTQPKNTTVANGETAKLTVKAKGDDLKYTWYIKNAGGTKYSKSSITKSTYSVKMSDKVHGRYVYCIVTDKYGKTEKSKTVVLKQKADPLTIATQPEDVYCSVGDEVGFGVVVKGGTAPYTYQWQYTVAAFTDWDMIPEEFILRTGDMVSAVLPGVTESHLDPVANFRVRCVITDAKGAQVITNEARPLSKMVIVTQPVNDCGNSGNQCTFKVQVSGGTEPYTYQWQWSDYSQPWQDLDSPDASGEKTNWLDIIVAQDEFDLEIKYRCVITDANGQQVITDTVWVERPLYIKTQPSNYAAAVNEAAYFEVVVAGGKGPFTYQWQYMANNFSWTDVAGWANGTDATLSFDVGSNEFTSGYQYRCVITDATGRTVTTNTVKVLNKDDLLRITSQPVNDYGQGGNQCTFKVQVAGGTGPYTYQWQWSDYSQPWQDLDSPDASGEKTNWLDIIVAQDEFDLETKYRCVITDADGTQVITNAVWVIPG